ncbi:MAG: tetratricopeptide repeat protein, partial [Bacteroidota bacterium]
MNKFSELLPMAENYKTNNPSPDAYSLYAELLWKTGKTNEADREWERAIELNPGNAKTYLKVFESQSGLMLFDKAIATLKEGRDNLGKPEKFANELSQLYIATGNYQAGTDEALNLLRNQNNLAVVQGRLYALMANPEAEKYVGSRLNDFASNNSNNILAQLLYAWYATTTGNYDRALEAYINIDRLQNSRGREVIQFANRSRADGHYRIALRAYEWVIDSKDARNYLSSALYGYARTLEKKMSDNDRMKPEEVNNIIARYRDIIEKFPDNANSAECRYRIATLALEQLEDPNMAIKELRQLIETQPNFPISAEATNLLGEIYMIKDDFESARKIFENIIDSKSRYQPDVVELAMYNMAQLHFYNSRIDSAKKYYTMLAGRSESDESNNSLLKLFLINQNTEHNDALRKYGQGELASLRNNFAEAAEIFSEAAKSAPGTSLGQRSLIEAGLAHIKAGNYKSAIASADTLKSQYPESLYGDYALMIKGDAQLASGMKDAAIETWKKLLLDYPSSIYLDQAREKIRSHRDRES